jgi:hypothetical protein
MDKKTKISIASMAGILAVTVAVQFLPDGLGAGTNKVQVTRPPPAAPAPQVMELQSALSNPPAAPTSWNTNAPAPRLIPVYVLPEVIIIQAGGTVFRCIDPVHLNELTKLFGAYRLTNVVIYAPAQ